MIIRTKKDGSNPFVQIDKRPLSDNRISWRAKGIWVYLMSKKDDWTVISEDLIKQSTEGRDAVRVAMNELRKFGYAKLVNSQKGREWFVFEAPESARPDNPSLPDSAKPEKPTPENRTDWKSATNNKEIGSNKDLRKNEVIGQITLPLSLNGEPTSKPSRTGKEEGCEEFWHLYPKRRRESMKKTRELWTRKHLAESRERIIGALKVCISSDDWKKSDNQFVPSSTRWLNERRWEDGDTAAVTDQSEMSCNPRYTKTELDEINRIQNERSSAIRRRQQQEVLSANRQES